MDLLRLLPQSSRPQHAHSRKEILSGVLEDLLGLEPLLFDRTEVGEGLEQGKELLEVPIRWNALDHHHAEANVCVPVSQRPPRVGGVVGGVRHLEKPPVRP